MMFTTGLRRILSPTIFMPFTPNASAPDYAPAKLPRLGFRDSDRPILADDAVDGMRAGRRWAIT